MQLGSQPATDLDTSCAVVLASVAMARSVSTVRHQQLAHPSLVPVVQMAKVNSLPKGLTAPNGVFLIPSLITSLWKYPPSNSADWATWVQAFGSLAAIGIAIWVSRSQSQQALELERSRKRDEDAKEAAETRAFVQAVRDEVITLWAGYNDQIGPALRKIAEGYSFDFIYPAFTDAFTIYNGASSRVGKIPNDELRRIIVELYALAKGLVYSFQLNNKMLSDRQQLDLLYTGSDKLVRLQLCHQGLVQYAITLEERDAQIQQLIEIFIREVGDWLAKADEDRKNPHH